MPSASHREITHNFLAKSQKINQAFYLITSQNTLFFAPAAHFTLKFLDFGIELLKTRGQSQRGSMSSILLMFRFWTCSELIDIELNKIESRSPQRSLIEAFRVNDWGAWSPSWDRKKVRLKSIGSPDRLNQRSEANNIESKLRIRSADWIYRKVNTNDQWWSEKDDLLKFIHLRLGRAINWSFRSSRPIDSPRRSISLADRIELFRSSRWRPNPLLCSNASIPSLDRKEKEGRKGRARGKRRRKEKKRGEKRAKKRKVRKGKTRNEKKGRMRQAIDWP